MTTPLAITPEKNTIKNFKARQEAAEELVECGFREALRAEFSKILREGIPQLLRTLPEKRPKKIMDEIEEYVTEAQEVRAEAMEKARKSAEFQNIEQETDE